MLPSVSIHKTEHTRARVHAHIFPHTEVHLLYFYEVQNIQFRNLLNTIILFLAMKPLLRNCNAFFPNQYNLPVLRMDIAVPPFCVQAVFADWENFSRLTTKLLTYVCVWSAWWLSALQRWMFWLFMQPLEVTQRTTNTNPCSVTDSCFTIYANKIL